MAQWPALASSSVAASRSSRRQLLVAWLEQGSRAQATPEGTLGAALCSSKRRELRSSLRDTRCENLVLRQWLQSSQNRGPEWLAAPPALFR